MFTIDRLAKLDSIAATVFGALSAGLDWLGNKYEDFLVNTTYRVVEAKAAAIGKAEDKISDLKYARYELVTHGEESRAILQQKHKAALDALAAEIAAKDDKINADLAAAAEALVAATKDYDAAVRDANDKLDVDVEVDA